MAKNKSNLDFFVRSSKSTFSTDNRHIELVNDLYEKILLLCESAEIKKISSAPQNLKRLLDKKVELKYRRMSKAMLSDDFTTTKMNWYIKKDVEVWKLDNKILFVSVEDNALQSLIKHIRNAFAHNRIIIDGDYISLGDFCNDKDKRTTMLGRMTIENFELLINTINGIRLIQDTETKK